MTQNDIQWNLSKGHLLIMATYIQFYETLFNRNRPLYNDHFWPVPSVAAIDRFHCI